MLPAIISAIVVANLVRVVLILGDSEWMQEAAYVWTISRLDALAAGGLLAVLLRSSLVTIRQLHWLTWGGLASMLLVVGITHQFAANHDGISILNQTLACFTFAGLIGLGALDNDARFQVVLKWRAIVWLGRISYAI